MERDFIKLKEIKPVLTGYIGESRAMLKSTVPPQDRVIHDVRVLMKKSRAALKLAAPQLESEWVNRDLVALREVGRKMCAWRENSVLRKNLKWLKNEYPDIFSSLGDNERITALLKKPDVNTLSTDSIGPELENINELLRKTAFRIRFMSMNKIDPQLLIKELERSYEAVTDIYLACRNRPKPDLLHEFRKKGKDFLYQLYFFRPLNPQEIKVLEKRLDDITRYLGRYNDLTQLVKALDYEYSFNSHPPAMDELVIRIRELQDRYLSKIWPSAFKIFCPGQNLINVLGFKLLVI